MTPDPADRVAAWAVGAGIGLITLMVIWLVGYRVAAVIWEPPIGPSVALAVAILGGIAATMRSGARLARRR